MGRSTLFPKASIVIHCGGHPNANNRTAGQAGALAFVVDGWMPGRGSLSPLNFSDRSADALNQQPTNAWVE